MDADTIRLTEAEQAELARRVAAVLAEMPPSPEPTEAELDDMAARWGDLPGHAEGELD